MNTSAPLGFLATLFCLIASPGSAEIIPSLANGFDGYWTFDETSGGVLHDYSGHGFDGTLVNFAGGQGTWTSGKIGGALQFGGPSSGQSVRVNNFAMPTTSMTLTAWVWANSLPRWATVASNWNGAWGAFNYATFGGDPNMSVYAADANVQGGINIDYGISSASLSLNQWYFLAFTADSATGRISFFQNGVPAGSFSYRGQLLASSSQLNLGDDPSDTETGQGNWDGKLDDLAIWTRALNAQEITSIYNAGLAGRSLLTLIPEPSAMALCSVGMLMALWKRVGKR